MAEIVFSIATNVLEKLGSLAYQEIIQAWDLEKDLEKLKDTMSTIKKLLLDAEKKQAREPELQSWLENLKAVFLDAEDVFDAFECEALRRQVVRQYGSASRKVRRFFSSSNPLVFRFKMGQKMKEIRERLDEISALKDKFHLSEQPNIVHKVRETHSFVQASQVIGRDEDEESIIKLLMQPGDGEKLPVIPIVGIGGMGKTTLAKLVYNDDRVGVYFDRRIWLCVSDDFNEEQLITKIVTSVTRENLNNLTIDTLQSKLREVLNEKRYLLVLDDVWNKDPRKWNNLKDLLMEGGNGSKVIVTTRSNNVASVVNPSFQYDLKGLPYMDCVSLFVKYAFPGRHDQQYPNLMSIGEDIVRKCGGLPLAVITLATLLSSTREEHKWILIKDSEIWELEQRDENDVLPALRLSYDQLPSYLKPCFAYCSVFPKNYLFVDFQLIHFWMAHGLLLPSSNNKIEELEDIGKRYLKELGSRCFFQDFHEKSFLGATFKMHDLIHDLALSVLKNECSIIKSKNQQILRNIRHLSFPQPYQLGENSLVMNRVRTIHFQTDFIILDGVGWLDTSSQLILRRCISKFHYLRELTLDGPLENKELLTAIGGLKHLRLLYLSFSYLKKLPESICKLQNLQTLILLCEELEELPKGLRCMVSLRFLYISASLKCLPGNGIAHLAALRSLWLIGCPNLEHLCEDIQCLKNLRTLVIFNCHKLMCLPQGFKNLTALENLAIVDCGEFDLTTEGEGKDIQQDSFSVFNLRNLLLELLPKLVALPQWVLPLSLQNLQIQACHYLSTLPERMCQLTALRELRIRYCYKLSKRCRREGGADWYKIAHVSKIYVDETEI